MTIGAWVILGIIALIGLTVAALLISYGKLEESVVGIVVGIAIILVTVALCVLFYWFRANSESGKRALKDQQSNMNGGIERTVKVYDINGELIEEYSGKFDIETDRNSYILFDDEDGNRHMIYYTTGMIIVDEN